jgi:hypothetical protein
MHASSPLTLFAPEQPIHAVAAAPVDAPAFELEDFGFQAVDLELLADVRHVDEMRRGR